MHWVNEYGERVLNRYGILCGERVVKYWPRVRFTLSLVITVCTKCIRISKKKSFGKPWPNAMRQSQQPFVWMWREMHQLKYRPKSQNFNGYCLQFDTLKARFKTSRGHHRWSRCGYTISPVYAGWVWLLYCHCIWRSPKIRVSITCGYAFKNMRRGGSLSLQLCVCLSCASRFLEVHRVLQLRDPWLPQKTVLSVRRWRVPGRKCQTWQSRITRQPRTKFPFPNDQHPKTPTATKRKIERADYNQYWQKCLFMKAY